MKDNYIQIQLGHQKNSNIVPAYQYEGKGSTLQRIKVIQPSGLGWQTITKKKVRLLLLIDLISSLEPDDIGHLPFVRTGRPERTGSH